MIAWIADLLGSRREYCLFDSFEGRPSAKAIDGREDLRNGRPRPQVRDTTTIAGLPPTMVWLKHQYPYVAGGGIIIIDDHQAWDGCTHVLHGSLVNLSDYDDRPKPRQYDSERRELTTMARSYNGIPCNSHLGRCGDEGTVYCVGYSEDLPGFESLQTMRQGRRRRSDSNITADNNINWSRPR